MEKPHLIKPQVIVFDIYQTLLDMTEMARKINLITDSKRGYTIWFALFAQYCFANNSLDNFYDFISVAKAALQMTGHKLGKPISNADAEELLTLFEHLPIHEDVQQGLSQLRDKGYRIAALTNVPEKIISDRMERTGLISYFERLFCSENVKKYKPEKKVYQWASDKLNTDIQQMLMVTAHGWDLAGAANAGMKTAFLKRNRQLLFPLSPPPDLICKTVIELASFLNNSS